jgi:glycine/D-amino acid oxidase-like deaminating enzyme
MASFDVLVLGGGIVGCACARELSFAGLRVGVIEPGVVGGGATAAGMGHVVVMDDSPAQLALTRLSRALWQQLQPQLPAAVEYEPRGTLWVAADEEEMSEVDAKKRLYSSAQVASEVLDGKALAAAEPQLRPGLAGGLLVPEDAVCYPPAAAAFFLGEAVRAGAVLLQGMSASHIGSGSVTLQNGAKHIASRVVVATGADIALLPWLPIQRRKGHLLITDRYPGFVHHQLVELGYLKSAHKLAEDSVAFNVQPRSTGQLLIGSSRQYGDEWPGVNQKIFAEMLKRACEYMPSIAQLSGIRAWTGFRAATPDKLPLIGPTGDPTIFVAAGFEGLGITNAPGAARLLADQMLGRPSEIDATPYLPERVARIPIREVIHA